MCFINTALQPGAGQQDYFKNEITKMPLIFAGHSQMAWNRLKANCQVVAVFALRKPAPRAAAQRL
jgi:hypothetical protein